MLPFSVICTWSPKKWDWNPLTLIGWAIERITRGGPSHVRLYLCKDIFWEVTFPHPRFGHMSEIEEGVRIEIGRHKDLPLELFEGLKSRAMAEMIRINKTFYDVPELAVEQLLDEMGIDHVDHSDPKAFVCSSGVNYIHALIGYSFAEGLVSPQDIRKSKFYRKEESEIGH